MSIEPRKAHRCEACPIRSRAAASPQRLLSRIWRWHTHWCPGWKDYQASRNKTAST